MFAGRFQTTGFVCLFLKRHVGALRAHVCVCSCCVCAMFMSPHVHVRVALCDSDRGGMAECALCASGQRERERERERALLVDAHLDADLEPRRNGGMRGLRIWIEN